VGVAVRNAPENASKEAGKHEKAIATPKSCVALA